MLRLSQVDPNRSQPRQKFEEEALEELADSIRQFGVLQPILVKRNGSRYEIIAGERRWRASRKAGLTEIPAIVREYTDMSSGCARKTWRPGYPNPEPRSQTLSAC